MGNVDPVRRRSGPARRARAIARNRLLTIVTMQQGQGGRNDNSVQATPMSFVDRFSR